MSLRLHSFLWDWTGDYDKIFERMKQEEDRILEMLDKSR